MSELAPGTLVDRRYRVIRVLGAGTVGTVYEVEHEEIGARFALKLVAARMMGLPTATERFQREARTAAALQSPHVVRVTDYGWHGDRPYLVMELLEGRTLTSAWWARAFGPAELVRLLTEVLDGLSSVHARGVVHRDVKPDNLFVVERDGQRTAKLLDFGLAKLLAPEDDLQSVAGAVFGTPRYMAPEQAAGEAVDPRADLYAIGVILFELLAGRAPFQGENAAEVLRRHMLDPAPELVVTERAPGLDVDAVRAIVRWCLEKSPGDRPATAEDLRRALVAALRPGGADDPDVTRQDLRAGLVENLPVMAMSSVQSMQLPLAEVRSKPGWPRPKRPAPADGRSGPGHGLAIAATLLLVAGGLGALSASRGLDPPAAEELVERGAPVPPNFTPPVGFEDQSGPPFVPMPLAELDVAAELARRGRATAARARFERILDAHPDLPTRPELEPVLDDWGRQRRWPALDAFIEVLSNRDNGVDPLVWLAEQAPTFALRRAAYEGLEAQGQQKLLDPPRYLADQLRRNGTDVCAIRRWYVQRLTPTDDPDLLALLERERERRGGFLDLERKGACLDEIVEASLSSGESADPPWAIQ